MPKIPSTSQSTTSRPLHSPYPITTPSVPSHSSPAPSHVPIPKKPKRNGHTILGLGLPNPNPKPRFVKPAGHWSHREALGRFDWGEEEREKEKERAAEMRRRRELARAKNTSTSEPKRWRLKRPEDTRYGSIARVIDPNAVDESDPEMNDDARTLVETEVDAGDWAEAV